MTKKQKFDITCPAADCGQTFPVVITLDPGGKGPSTMQHRCPFCQRLLTLELEEPLAEQEIHLRKIAVKE